MEFPHGSKEISFSIDDQQDDTKLNTSDGPSVPPVEKEHMFDKVVTPSDVGKLNRLVLPKQHAEKYFPLDSVANEKGLVLCFEDCNGKPWCFRYSYWNSSQSYVITKGWSRFVKDHRLDTGDTVSFSRGRGDGAQDRLFIDCKHRQQPILTAADNQYHYPFLSINHSTLVPSGIRQDGGSRRYVYLPSVAATVPHGSVQEEVLDSVPVVTRQAAAKRVRLFGVNLDCPESAAELQTKAVLPQLQLALGSSSEEKQAPMDPGL